MPMWSVSESSPRRCSGELQYVQAGDIVLTKAGEFHDFVEVYEPVTGFFTEIGVPAGGRTGHLDPDPHDVPAPTMCAMR